MKCMYVLNSDKKTFARKIKETDALLNTYLHMLSQAQQRRTLMGNSSWHGASEEARREAKLKAQKAAAAQAASAAASERPMHPPPGASTTSRSARGRAPTSTRGVASSMRGRNPPASSGMFQGLYLILFSRHSHFHVHIV